jgi:hypothetical protein
MSSRGRGVRPLLFLLLLATAIGPFPARGAPGRFRLEISAGGLALAPADLNRAAEIDRLLQELRYDRYFEYLRLEGAIESWRASSQGERPRIRSGWLLEPRLRYELGRSLSLSLGLRFLQGGGERQLAFEYVRELGAGDRDVELLAYSPYRLEARGWWPSLGVHLRRRLGRRLHAEGYALAGPLFAGVEYRSAWTYAWDMRGTNYSWPVFRDAGERQEEGSGAGLGVELGARIELPLGRRLAVFAVGGHCWQRLRSLSGTGHETRAGAVDSWSGKWVSRSETFASPWAAVAFSYPSCRPGNNAGDGPFRLDLSGWQLRLGLSWRL